VLPTVFAGGVGENGAIWLRNRLLHGIVNDRQHPACEMVAASGGPAP
jgi:hypothetical protein